MDETLLQTIETAAKTQDTAPISEVIRDLAQYANFGDSALTDSLSAIDAAGQMKSFVQSLNDDARKDVIDALSSAADKGDDVAKKLLDDFNNAGGSAPAEGVVDPKALADMAAAIKGASVVEGKVAAAVTSEGEPREQPSGESPSTNPQETEAPEAAPKAKAIKEDIEKGDADKLLADIQDVPDRELKAIIADLPEATQGKLLEMTEQLKDAAKESPNPEEAKEQVARLEEAAVEGSSLKQLEDLSPEKRGEIMQDLKEAAAGSSGEELQQLERAEKRLAIAGEINALAELKGQELQAANPDLSNEEAKKQAMEQINEDVQRQLSEGKSEQSIFDSLASARKDLERFMMGEEPQLDKKPEELPPPSEEKSGESKPAGGLNLTAEETNVLKDLGVADENGNAKEGWTIKRDENDPSKIIALSENPKNSEYTIQGNSDGFTVKEQTHGFITERDGKPVHEQIPGPEYTINYDKNGDIIRQGEELPPPTEVKSENQDDKGTGEKKPADRLTDEERDRARQALERYGEDPDKWTFEKKDGEIIARNGNKDDADKELTISNDPRTGGYVSAVYKLGERDDEGNRTREIDTSAISGLEWRPAFDAGVAANGGKLSNEGSTVDYGRSGTSTAQAEELPPPESGVVASNSEQAFTGPAATGITSVVVAANNREPNASFVGIEGAVMNAEANNASLPMLGNTAPSQQIA